MIQRLCLVRGPPANNRSFGRRTSLSDGDVDDMTYRLLRSYFAQSQFTIAFNIDGSTKRLVYSMTMVT